MNKVEIATKQAKDVLVQRHYKEFLSIYKYKLSRVKDDILSKQKVVGAKG